MEKYKKDTELQIPIEQRQKLNEKILYLVENHEAELYGVIRQIKRCRFHQIKTGLSEHLTMG